MLNTASVSNKLKLTNACVIVACSASIFIVEYSFVCYSSKLLSHLCKQTHILQGGHLTM